jgi:hypothetical protein
MATSIRQLDLFEGIIPPDTPLGVKGGAKPWRGAGGAIS